MRLRNQLLVILGIFISLFFLWVAFNGLNPAAVWRYVQEAQVGWLLLGVGVFFISMVLIAWRWGFLLRGVRRLPILYLSGLVSIAYMGNNVYPLRAGEFLRIFLLQRDYQVPVARTTTTIFIERIFDGFVMLLFILVPLRFISIASPQLQQAVEVAAPLFGGGLLAFLILALNPGWIRALTRFMMRFLPAKPGVLVYKLSEDVISGMDSLRQPRWLAGATLASFATWVFNAAVYWVVSFAFGLQHSFWVFLVITGAVNLAGVLPASPGQIGVFEFFVSTILIAVGVADELAIAYALVVHLVIWLPPTLLGFVLLIRRGFDLAAIGRLQSASMPASTVNG
jgi:uncharacterized protein (TIRG00374 family)